MLGEFGPYFTDRYQTPWGQAVNFDGAGSDEVRAFFASERPQWFGDFHIDGLRLDAVHEIIDRSATTFLAELAVEADRASRFGAPCCLIAESADNDPACRHDPLRRAASDSMRNGTTTSTMPCT